MILRNRSFDRNPPSREAKNIYIFCEGVKREYQYFTYFREIDSRINIEVYELAPEENNSPAGLYKIACDSCVKSDENPDPKYELVEGDEVWIVFDTDLDDFNSRKAQIEMLRGECALKANWNVAQSNPCFEVWLYYHATNVPPNTELNLDHCKSWKNILNDLVPGGFNSKKHPINIKDAINNSENNFSCTEGHPDRGCTEVHQLGKIIYESTREKLEGATG